MHRKKTLAARTSTIKGNHLHRKWRGQLRNMLVPLVRGGIDASSLSEPRDEFLRPSTRDALALCLPYVPNKTFFRM